MARTSHRDPRWRGQFGPSDVRHTTTVKGLDVLRIEFYGVTVFVYSAVERACVDINVADLVVKFCL